MSPPPLSSSALLAFLYLSSHSSSALLAFLYFSSHSSSALIAFLFLSSHSSSAQLAFLYLSSHTPSALLAFLFLSSHPSSALLAFLFLSSNSSSAFLSFLYLSSHSSSALLAFPYLSSHSFPALLAFLYLSSRASSSSLSLDHLSTGFFRHNFESLSPLYYNWYQHAGMGCDSLCLLLTGSANCLLILSIHPFLPLGMLYEDFGVKFSTFPRSPFPRRLLIWYSFLSIFRCNKAPLWEGPSVRPSFRPTSRPSIRAAVRPSVGPYFGAPRGQCWTLFSSPVDSLSFLFSCLPLHFIAPSSPSELPGPDSEDDLLRSNAF